MSDTTFISLGVIAVIGLGVFIFTSGGGWIGLCLYIVVLALIAGLGG